MAITLETVLKSYDLLQKDVYRLKESMKFMTPIGNKDYGKVAPNTEYLYDGLVAYANGTDWDPGSGKGLYRYNTTTSAWVLVG